MFSSLEAGQLNKVLEVSPAIDLEKGSTLFVQNQAALHFYVLASGQVKLTRTAIDGNEKVIDIINPPQTFAEAVILSQYEVYPVDAQAITDSRVIAIEAETYLGFLKNSPELCLSVMARMGQRMHWLINEIDRLVLHNATYRLISYLLEQISDEQAHATEFRLKTPKLVIASRLSITPETLSRTLKALSRRQLIDYRRDGTIQLKNVPELRRLISLEMTDTPAESHDALGKCPRI